MKYQNMRGGRVKLRKIHVSCTYMNVTNTSTSKNLSQRPRIMIQIKHTRTVDQRKQKS